MLLARVGRESHHRGPQNLLLSQPLTAELPSHGYSRLREVPELLASRMRRNSRNVGSQTQSTPCLSLQRTCGR